MLKKRIGLAEVAADSRTVVVAGHFQVDWCPLRKKFIPVIASEALENPELPMPLGYKTLLKSRADFPERTLKMGADLCRASDAALLILADDVYFTRLKINEATSDELSGARLALRMKGLPSSYRSLLEGVRLLGSEEPDSLIPDIFSEHRLNRQFSVVKSVQLGVSCEAEDCTCSDTALQLLITISLKGYHKAVLYLPAECAGKVEAAVGRAIPTLLDEVECVWGHLNEHYCLTFESWRFSL